MRAISIFTIFAVVASSPSGASESVPAAQTSLSLPLVRSGLWLTGDGKIGLGGGGSFLCVDEEVQPLASPLLLSGGYQCGVPVVSTKNGKLHYDVRCGRRDQRMEYTLHTGDFEREFWLFGNTVPRDIPLPKRGDTSVMANYRYKIRGQYAGACPAQMRPGEVVVRNELLDMRTGAVRPGLTDEMIEELYRRVLAQRRSSAAAQTR